MWNVVPLALRSKANGVLRIVDQRTFRSVRYPYFPDYPPNSLQDPKVEQVIEDICIGKYEFCSDKQWTPPLFLAAEYGNLKMLERLIDSGHGINIQDSLGETALIYAARENKCRAVKFLLSHGAQSDILNYEGARAEDFTLDPRISRAIDMYNSCPPSQIEQEEEEEEDGK